MWYESVAGIANWFSHKIRRLDPRRVCLLPSNGYPCYRPRKTGVRSTGLFADEPRMPVGVFKHSNGEEAIPGLMERAGPLGCGSEELAGSDSLSASMKKMVPASVLSERP